MKFNLNDLATVKLSKKGLIYDRAKKLEFYEHCMFGKQKRMNFSKDNHNTKGTVNYVHSHL